MSKNRADASPGEPMVGWYDLKQLARTGVDVAISTIFGRASDFRMLEALRAPDDDKFETKLPEDGQPAWVDYVGDTGDGWNSTYSVAYWMTQPALTVETLEGEKVTVDTRTGQILVFGGDQVYPSASRAEYENRLVKPYKAACAHTEEPYPQLYAIPGNHDWYDNLVSFTRLFCSKEWFAGWKTHQKRSYFALHLPYGWWLIGTDIQLGSDIDEEQLKYFKNAAKAMKPGDRVILCTAEPHWIFAQAYAKSDPDYYSEKTLSFLETQVFPRRTEIFLAGDLHHYRRHEGDGGKQKITSGGGGAFLHPTHGADFDELHQDLEIEVDAPGGKVTQHQHTTYVKKASYPSVSKSFQLGFRNLDFLRLNPTFGLFTGMLYLFCAWVTLPKVAPGRPVLEVLRLILLDPQATLLFVSIILGIIFFTDTHSGLYRAFGGGIHALAHIVAASWIGRAAASLAEQVFPTESIRYLLLIAALVFIAGWIVGSIIFGLYLLISLNFFSRHWNESFSSLKIEDYKNFIRMRIDPDGTLTIFPIGIEKVARRWTESSKAGGPKYEPVEPFTKPMLIEKPIVIPKR